jgi:hypothetical protein
MYHLRLIHNDLVLRNCSCVAWHHGLVMLEVDLDVNITCIFVTKSSQDKFDLFLSLSVKQWLWIISSAGGINASAVTLRAVRSNHLNKCPSHSVGPAFFLMPSTWQISWSIIIRCECDKWTLGSLTGYPTSFSRPVVTRWRFCLHRGAVLRMPQWRKFVIAEVSTKNSETAIQFIL